MSMQFKQWIKQALLALTSTVQEKYLFLIKFKNALFFIVFTCHLIGLVDLIFEYVFNEKKN